MELQLQQLKVEDIMVANPMRLHEDTPLEEIFRAFSTHQMKCLPVVDGDGRLEGCITLSDLEKSRQLFDLKEYIGIIVSGLEEDLRSRIASTFSLDGPIDLRAREVMSVKTPRLKPTDTVAEACRQMVDFKCHYAMVVDEIQQVIGIINSFDIMMLMM